MTQRSDRPKRATVPIHLKAALTVWEAAEYSSVGESTIRRLIDEGLLARAPHTNRVVIARREVERWVESTMAVAS